jgi:hypothetical protein
MILVSDQRQMDGSNPYDYKKNDGISLIQTGDLRHVKAGNSGLSDVFFRGEITTRNANAP